MNLFCSKVLYRSHIWSVVTAMWNVVFKMPCKMAAMTLIGMTHELWINKVLKSFFSVSVAFPYLHVFRMHCNYLSRSSVWPLPDTMMKSSTIPLPRNVLHVQNILHRWGCKYSGNLIFRQTKHIFSWPLIVVNFCYLRSDQSLRSWSTLNTCFFSSQLMEVYLKTFIWKSCYLLSINFMFNVSKCCFIPTYHYAWLDA